MIFAAGQFEPDEPEGSARGKSQYLGKKDFLWIAAILVVLGVFLLPVYNNLKRDAEMTQCRRNLRAMGSAIQVYAASFDDRFPPIYAQGENFTPFLEENTPIVWASTIAPFMPKDASFRCPAATDDEITLVRNNPLVGKKPIELSYGMYAGLSAAAVGDVSDPNQTMLITETSNEGARDTYNPSPFKLGDGTVVPFSGFMVGWDNSNLMFDDATKSVTRLAIYGTGDGNFEKENIKFRHGDRIFGIKADMSLGKIEAAGDMLVQRGTFELRGRWGARDLTRRR